MDKPLGFIYETENFYVKTAGTCFVDREEGGHIIIKMKEAVSNRTKLRPQLAIEFMRLSMIIGEAYKTAMEKRGINIINLNYQDMGNWAWKENPVVPKFHLHIFGRVKNATKQVFPEAVKLPPKESGFYDGNERLNAGDIAEIRKQIEILSKEPKYAVENWCII